MEIVSGIYQIRNKIDGKIYIGSSKNIHVRWNSHISAFKRGDHANIHLQKAWEKYGSDAFEFSILERVNDLNNLKNREQYWMDKLQPFGSIGYNMCPTTNSYSFGDKKPQSMRDKLKKPKSAIHIQHMRESAPHRQNVMIFDLKGNHIFTAMSRGHAAEYMYETFGLSYRRQNIGSYCNGVIHQNRTGYIFMWEKDYVVNPSLLEERLNYKARVANAKSVVRISMDFKTISIFQTYKEAEEQTGLNSATITNVIRNNAIVNGEYYWLSAEEYQNHECDYDIYIIQKLREKKTRIGEKIIQINPITMNAISVWENASAVGREWNRDATGISRCVKGKIKTSLKYKWMYASEYFCYVRRTMNISDENIEFVKDFNIRSIAS